MHRGDTTCIAVGGKWNLTDPKVPEQCALLVSVGRKQGGTLGIELGNVWVRSRGKKLEKSNKFWTLLNFEDCDYNSGTESLEYYLRALIPFYGLVLRKKSRPAILHAVFKFLAGNVCFAVCSVCGWIITVASADEMFGGGGGVLSRYNLPGPGFPEYGPTRFIIFYLSR
jgi:hypothetical protein